METVDGKLFVGGLLRHVTEVALKQHFSKYGEVKEYVIIVDKVSRKQRGFGFVTFTDPLFAKRALQDEHIIFGKKVDVKPAKPKVEKSQSQCLSQSQEDQHAQALETNRKIFVGGLPRNLTKEELKNYFERFGTVKEEVVICEYDKQNRRRSRGFGFITFDSEEAVHNALQERFHELNNKFVEVKRAHPRCDPNNVGSMGFGYYYVPNPYGLGTLMFRTDRGGYLAWPGQVPTSLWNGSYLLPHDQNLQTYVNSVYPTYMCNGSMGYS